MVAFVLFATIVYFLPLSRIKAEVDANLAALAAEILQGKIDKARDGALEIVIPQDLITLETASTFILITNAIDPDATDKRIFSSRNLGSFEGLLDPEGLGTTKVYHDVTHGDVSLRVLTVPIYDYNDPERPVIGYLQVARLFDSYESFSRFLVIALFVGFAGATASLFLAVLLTPSSFKPLEDIADVARQITNADDLSRRVPYIERGDEVGVLARAFNQLLERLENLFLTQQRLLADVSHELRTPLTTIRGNVDLMRRIGEADEDSLKIIQEETDRMSRLVGDLLLLARADAGSLPLERKKLELDTLFFEVYRQVSLLDTAVNVVITDIDQVCVMGDPDRLKQLLLNLAGNALKYTSSGGSVFLSLAKTEGWAIIRVKDTGVGIPPQDLPYVFERFYRVDKARTRQQGGSGLGLSIAQWIAQAHGGRIEVASEVGVGTTFTVWLPALADLPSLSDTADEGELESTRPGLRVLSTPFRR